MAVLSERVRRPAVAGYWYPQAPEALRQAVREATAGAGPARAARALIAPHGSLTHCGPILGATWAGVRIPRRVVLVGPAHTPAAAAWSLAAAAAWRTPLGAVSADREAIERLRSACPELRMDEACHRGEHAIEVHLPFLQVLGPDDLAITPVLAADERVDVCAALAQALAALVHSSSEPMLLVASSDLSHFEPAERGRAIDEELIRAMCRLESVALRQVVEVSETVMCGVGAVSCVLDAARALGATGGSVIARGASAQRGGDPGSSTGYAGMLIA
jgi:hypothetical protein